MKISLDQINDMLANGLITPEGYAALKEAQVAAGPQHYVIIDNEILNVGEKGEYAFKEAKRVLRESLEASAVEAKAEWTTYREAVKALSGLKKATVDENVYTLEDVPTEELIEESFNTL